MLPALFPGFKDFLSNGVEARVTHQPFCFGGKEAFAAFPRNRNASGFEEEGRGKRGHPIKHDMIYSTGRAIQHFLDPSEIATADADELYGKVTSFLKTKEGTRVLRNGKEPDLNEIKEWIDAANNVRSLKAA